MDINELESELSAIRRQSESVDTTWQDPVGKFFISEILDLSGYENALEALLEAIVIYEACMKSILSEME